MPHAPLTDMFLRKVKAPTTGRTEYYDGRIPGFGVRINASGSRTFFVLGRHQGKFRRISLGRYPTLGLEQARRKAHETLRSLSDGVDPTERRRQARKPPDDLFPQVVDSFLRLHCQRQNRASTAAETERLLRAVFVGRWSDRRLASITKADILLITDQMMANGTPSSARHAFAAIRKLFNWCVERGLLEQSPCLAMSPPAKAENRDRVLTDDELIVLWRTAPTVNASFGAIVQLLMLTGQRRGEVGGMRWMEIDWRNATWTIPSERTKNGRAHTVPLTPTTIVILKSLTNDDEVVFPARGRISTPYDGYSKAKPALDALAGVTGWTLHDLRRTAATGLAKQGVPPHVVERILNHVSGTFGGVAGIYNRFAYADEMRAALTQWEAHVLKIIGDEN